MVAQPQPAQRSGPSQECAPNDSRTRYKLSSGYPAFLPKLSKPLPTTQ